MFQWQPQFQQSLASLPSASSIPRPYISQAVYDIKQPGEDVGEEYLDVLRSCSAMDLYHMLKVPPAFTGIESPIVYADNNRSLLSDAVLSCLTVKPNTVIFHVYDVNEDFTRANDVTVFGVGVGGALHVGTEIYGGEWSFGGYGVTMSAPRSQTHHIYKCSIILGCTSLQRMDVANILHDMIEDWSGSHYDLIRRNCCTFASEFCDRLGVGPMPAWIDRLPRYLSHGHDMGQRVSVFAQELPGRVQPHLRNAAQQAQNVMTEVKPHLEQGANQAQDMFSRLWVSAADAGTRVSLQWQHLTSRGSIPEEEQDEEEEEEPANEDGSHFGIRPQNGYRTSGPQLFNSHPAPAPAPVANALPRSMSEHYPAPHSARSGTWQVPRMNSEPFPQAGMMGPTRGSQIGSRISYQPTPKAKAAFPVYR